MMAKILRKNHGLGIGWRAVVGALVIFLPSLSLAVTNSVSAGSMRVRSSSEKTGGERELREAILQLSGPEAVSYQAALNQLLAAPRAQVLAVLREDLAAGPQITRATVNAAVVLRARELFPELKAVAQQTEFWWVFAGLNTLLRGDDGGIREFAPIYSARLERLLSTTARLAVLNGLVGFHVSVPRATFDALLESPSYELRIATVRHWLATRDLLSASERRYRLEKVLAVEPRQARILAFREVPRLPASERAHAKKSLSKERCEREADASARAACRKAEASLGGRP